MTSPSAFTDIFVPLSDVSVACAVLTGLAFSMRRAHVAAVDRQRILTVAAAAAAFWYGAVSLLATRGIFTATPGARFSALPLAVAVPIILALVALPRAPLAMRLLDAAPLSRLVGVQVLRVIGVVFLVEWALGSLPAAFALPAALGDIAVGLLAIPVARLVARRSRVATIAVSLWSALGLFDFALALATGFLSSPGRFQILALDHPNLLVSSYPLVLIPSFGVPVFVVLHGLAIWKMRRGALRASSPNLVGSPA